MYKAYITTSLHETNILSKKNFLACLLICVCILIIPKRSNAQGVEAGTNIANIAIASYTVDSIPQEPIESSPNGNSQSGDGKGQSTDFVVDRKIDLLVTGNSNANVTPGDSQAEVTFTLQNQGNATQEFSLVPNGLLTSDNFDVDNCTVEISSVSGSPIPGVVVPTNGNIKLRPDQQASVQVKCDVPLDNSGTPISIGNTSLVNLTATAIKNEDGTPVTEATKNTANNIDTVFIDGDGTEDNIRDASHSARRTYIATSSTVTPELEMNKSILSVIDPNGGDTAITGSEVTYKIKINTSGVGTIKNLIVTDTTPADMSYKTNSIKLDAISQTDISDTNDATNFGITAADTATINLGDFVAGSEYEILLTYTIN